MFRKESLSVINKAYSSGGHRFCLVKSAALPSEALVEFCVEGITEELNWNCTPEIYLEDLKSPSMSLILKVAFFHGSYEYKMRC